ncbi:hypothetical protein A2690_00445 [Candidatus Roizmanbacteria bacterium RIFCSPHIGHO2_01_FULL_39_12b]|uniref:DUF3307 domain-containing protein n=1 Tax=Candidatus Roizmanbacteria bacterium RIFCSPHIGHO2_01_FULL_39_12b TaxID=1802030 RepID=A0A1F7G8M4_9BACT|nr:MAG: hypothetical protein A2690_00445 [Candidatus Roizmanbacteria bacterium RIFCSPHIGHO2_01_FULL_39_12b]OGK46033.1 MAG: hypothetical protein A3B46_00735 [Candidatus Roizmanbacteria bacterium RIFCSPLOWO2_01_FULL_39_19]
MEQQLIRALAAHFIGDFAFQTDWMAQNKGKSYEVNFYHAATYTATFVLLGAGLSPLQLIIILVSHFFIDLLKARWGIVKYI